MSIRSAFAFAVGLGAVASMGGCHDHGGGTGADEYNVDCEVPGTGATVTASDEDFRAFVDAEKAGAVKTAPAESLPRIGAPDSATMLSASVPPTFTILPGSSLAVGPAAPHRSATRASDARTRTPSLWQRLRGAFVLERQAHAHCPPSSGEKYLLRLESSRGQPLYTAVLTVTSFTPRADRWSARLSGHKGEVVTATLLRARFVDNEIGEGPYAASPAPTWTLAP